MAVIKSTCDKCSRNMVTSVLIHVSANSGKGFLTWKLMERRNISTWLDNDKVWLTAHNEQKWKRVFLTCPCHEIHRDGAVGLKKNANLLGKLRFLRICGIWGNSFAHVWHIYNYNYLQHNKFRFNLIDFQLNRDVPSQLCVFTVKSTSVTQRSVSQENAFKKSKNPWPFSAKI